MIIVSIPRSRVLLFNIFLCCKTYFLLDRLLLGRVLFGREVIDFIAINLQFFSHMHIKSIKSKLLLVFISLWARMMIMSMMIVRRTWCPLSSQKKTCAHKLSVYMTNAQYTTVQSKYRQKQCMRLYKNAQMTIEFLHDKSNNEERKKSVSTCGLENIQNFRKKIKKLYNHIK